MPMRDLDSDDPLAIHLQVEAMKLALVYAETYVADDEYMTGVTSEVLLDETYLASRAALIDETCAQIFTLVRRSTAVRFIQQLPIHPV
jgi:gamma-glutamyltranspeptidase/glutathione hydrolase